jgi:hypothetical protein
VARRRPAWAIPKWPARQFSHARSAAVPTDLGGGWRINPFDLPPFDPAADFPPPPMTNDTDADAVPPAAGDADEIDDAEAELDPDEVVL